MADIEDNNQPPQQQPHLKIPAFWSSNPEAWFGMVEGQFVLKGVTQDTMKFYHVLQSLTETAVRCLGDLMRGPPPEDANLQLKARLLAAHTLTEFQRMEKLLPGRRTWTGIWWPEPPFPRSRRRWRPSRVDGGGGGGGGR